MAQRFERTYFRSRDALLKRQRDRAATTQDQTAEPAPAILQNKPTFLPPPPTGWRRWFPVLAIFIRCLLAMASLPPVRSQLTIRPLAIRRALLPISVALAHPAAARTVTRREHCAY